MLFASLYLDRRPLDWTQLPAALTIWVQVAGVVAAVGIALVLLARALSRNPNEWIVWSFSERLRPAATYMRFAVLLSGIGYVIHVLLMIGGFVGVPRIGSLLPRPFVGSPYTFGDWNLTVASLLALSVVCMPLFLDIFTRISFGRIWAMAKLSWKEAIRGRVVWVFGAIALIFLFAEWFITSKPEDQLRNYVRLVYWSITPLFLIAAGLLGSFSIPNDVRNNSIHTIVTKPVEKFEIVLGRFLGYAALLTIGLLTISLLSLIYVVRGVNEDATRESYKARVPIYGGLHFYGTKDAMRGDNVGREWTYRSYITGPTRHQPDSMRQYAVWDFWMIPAELANRETPILFEFAFDIFRLSKGKEGEGVFCTFTFTDGVRDWRDLESSVKAMKEKKNNLIKIAGDQKDDALQPISLAEAAAIKKAGKNTDEIKKKFDAERAPVLKAYRDRLLKINLEMVAEFHIHQEQREVTDYHTQEILVTPAIFQAVLKEKNDPETPVLRVFVNVDQAREAQMVGVAPQDFYLVLGERPFWVNFLKGIVGMWCTHMLVLGVAVACSTYLTGVISFLVTMFLYVAGMFVDYLREIADRRLDGGGPMEALFRIGGRMPIAAKLDESPTTTVVESIDVVFSWWIGIVLNLLPDVNRHDLHMYVANGFDIALFDVLLVDNVLPLAGYLAPWAVFAYYLMKYREIANPS
jgi:hypothetical protein